MRIFPSRSVGTVLSASSLAAMLSCSSGGSTPAASLAGITFRSDVVPVTSVSQAEKGVFIPPFVDCRAPLPGDSPGQGPGGQVCTNVAISGCTEPDKSFASYAACDVVRTQRPYFPTPLAGASQANDPRLQDAAFMRDLAWAAQQVRASGCACCHDSKASGWPAAAWDVSYGPIWLDTLSNDGLALFIGLADSSVLGAYPSAQNHGFDRTSTGVPTTDTARMKSFLASELARRGISDQQAATVPPFGGPIYANSVAAPAACTAAEGVSLDGLVTWTGGNARYVHVLADGSKNPGVPPNLDAPTGTIWRLDVLASADALPSGIAYGETPRGSFQSVPDRARAPALQRGARYHFYVLRDVGIPLANCTFVYGQPGAGMQVGTSPPDAGRGNGGAGPSAADAGLSGVADACAAAAGDAGGFGTSCTTSGECPCSASYCAVQPGQTTGYCTATGCATTPSVCPQGWSCLDLAQFSAGLPSICTAN